LAQLLAQIGTIFGSKTDTCRRVSSPLDWLEKSSASFLAACDLYKKTHAMLPGFHGAFSSFSELCGSIPNMLIESLGINGRPKFAKRTNFQGATVYNVVV
jgi:hypothetical protein